VSKEQVFNGTVEDCCVCMQNGWEIPGRNENSKKLPIGLLVSIFLMLGRS